MPQISAELRRNPVSGTTVIIATGREKPLEKLRRIHPRDWSHHNQKLVSGEGCPFCVNHEAMTPPEIKSYRVAGTKANEPGWTVRVVPNLGPAVDQSFPGVMLEERQVGQFMATEGFGYHYVVIETTTHVTSMADLDPANARDIIHMWRDMSNTVTGDRNVKFVALFQNFGPQAGASQPHPHSQILALPVLPTRIRNEIHGAEKYYQENRDCVYCREIADEMRMGSRIIEKSENFQAWCPFISKTPYQVVISPREHQSYFANLSTYATADRLTEFTLMLQNVLKRLKVTLNDPDYNMYSTLR